MGIGVPQNLTNALHYYEKSDEHGYFLAPAALEVMYKSATNKVKSELDIYRLYKRSYERGNVDCVPKLVELSSSEMVKKEDAQFLSGFLQHWAARGYQPAIQKLAVMAFNSSNPSNVSAANPIIIKIEDDV